MTGIVLALVSTGCGSGPSSVSLTPLTIMATSPQDQETGVDLDQTVSILFSKNIDPFSSNSDTVYIKVNGSSLPGGNVPATVNTLDKVVTVTPVNSLAPATTYVVVITTGITDLQGVGLAEENSFTFTTKEGSSSSSSNANSSDTLSSSPAASSVDATSSTATSTTSAASSSDANSSQSTSGDSSATSSCDGDYSGGTCIPASSSSTSFSFSSYSSQSSSVTTTYNNCEDFSGGFCDPAYKATLCSTVLTVDTNDSQLLNPIIGGLLGQQLEIDAITWNDVISENIGLEDFLLALAGDLNVSTVGQLLDSALPASDILQALDVNGTGAISTVLAAINNPDLNSTLIPIRDLIDLPTMYNDILLANLAGTDLIDIPLNLVDLLTQVLVNYSIYNDQTKILTLNLDDLWKAAVDNNTSELPLLSGTVKLRLLTPCTTKIFTKTSAPSLSLYTSRTRLFLDLNVSLADLDSNTTSGLLSGITGTVSNLLGGLLDTLLGAVDLNDTIALGDLAGIGDVLHLPVYIEIGPAEADVASFTTTAGTIVPTTIVMNTSDGLTEAFIGDINETLFFTSTESFDETDFNKTAILTLSDILTVYVKAYADSNGTDLNETERQLTYLFENTYPELFTQHIPAPIGSDVNTLLFSLLGNIDVTVEALDLSITIDQANLDALTSNLITSLANGVLYPLGSNVLNPLSDLLGVYAGKAALSIEGPFNPYQYPNP